MNQENPLHKSTSSLGKEPHINPKKSERNFGDWEVKPKKSKNKTKKNKGNPSLVRLKR